MTREVFIRKWLGNPENRDEMRDDLDSFIAPTPSHYQFADKYVIDMMASIWGNEAARMFLTLSAFKYQMRAGRKTDDPTEDLEKARHCLELATEYHEIGPEEDIPSPYEEMLMLHKKPDDIPDTPNPNSSGNKPPQPPPPPPSRQLNEGRKTTRPAETWKDLKKRIRGFS